MVNNHTYFFFLFYYDLVHIEKPEIFSQLSTLAIDERANFWKAVLFEKRNWNFPLFPPRQRSDYFVNFRRKIHRIKLRESGKENRRCRPLRVSTDCPPLVSAGDINSDPVTCLLLRDPARHNENSLAHGSCPPPPPPSLKKSTKTRWRKNITLLLTFPWIHKCSTCFLSFSVNSSISKFWKATIFVFLMVDWTLKKRNRIRAQEIKWSSIQENRELFY